MGAAVNEPFIIHHIYPHSIWDTPLNSATRDEQVL